MELLLVVPVVDDVAVVAWGVALLVTLLLGADAVMTGWDGWAFFVSWSPWTAAVAKIALAPMPSILPFDNALPHPG